MQSLAEREVEDANFKPTNTNLFSHTQQQCGSLKSSQSLYINATSFEKYRMLALKLAIG